MAMKKKRVVEVTKEKRVAGKKKALRIKPIDIEGLWTPRLKTPPSWSETLGKVCYCSAFITVDELDCAELGLRAIQSIITALRLRLPRNTDRAMNVGAGQKMVTMKKAVCEKKKKLILDTLQPM